MEADDSFAKGGTRMVWIAGIWAAVNLCAFFAMGIDKRRAVKGRWRIPERTLFLWAAPMSAWGAWAGMKAFRHKTKKPLFRYGMPALCVVQTAIAGALLVWLSR